MSKRLENDKIMIYSGMTVPYQVTLSEDTNQVLLLPSSFTLNPGQNVIQVTVIPQSPFTGGVLTWALQGAVPSEGGYELCITEFEADIPWCNSSSKMNSESEDKIVSTNSFSIYPNPASTSITIKGDNFENEEIEIYNMLGQRVIGKSLITNEATVDISNLANGVYMVYFMNAKASHKFVKQ